MNLLDGLVSYWKFDETSGTTATDSVSSNNGTLNNARIFTRSTEGKIRTGADFRGGNDYITIVGFKANEDNVSICAWVKVNSYTLFGRIFDTYRGSAGQTPIALQTLTNPSRIHFLYQSSSPLAGAGVVYTTSSTNWMHVVGTREKIGSNYHMKLYINGVLEVENNFTLVPDSSSSTQARIGARATSLTEYFNGLIDEEMVYNRALSSDEVKYLYEIQRNGSPLGQYPFNVSGNSFGGGV
jgi:hypothetical protein